MKTRDRSHRDRQRIGPNGGNPPPDGGCGRPKWWKDLYFPLRRLYEDKMAGRRWSGSICRLEPGRPKVSLRIATKSLTNVLLRRIVSIDAKRRDRHFHPASDPKAMTFSYGFGDFHGKL